ncbi:MAG: tetratricopeptide repeat protein [Planctomycetota bacterium]|nr:tetratricopeptide repeat protein [Planctomycetota bacterium]
MPSLEQLQKLLAVDPSDAFVLYAIAQEHAKVGRHAEAVEFYDRCLGVDADYCYAYYHKAKSLQHLEREADAARVLEEGVQVARRVGDAKALSELQGFLALL